MATASKKAAAEPDTQTADDPEPVGPSQQVTTTSTKDFMGRSLVNATPGTSDATDHLGRAVGTGNKDHLGRALVA